MNKIFWISFAISIVLSILVDKALKPADATNDYQAGLLSVKPIHLAKRL